MRAGVGECFASIGKCCFGAEGGCGKSRRVGGAYAFRKTSAIRPSFARHGARAFMVFARLQRPAPERSGPTGLATPSLSCCFAKPSVPTASAIAPMTPRFLDGPISSSRRRALQSSATATSGTGVTGLVSARNLHVVRMLRIGSPRSRLTGPVMASAGRRCEEQAGASSESGRPTSEKTPMRSPCGLPGFSSQSPVSHLLQSLEEAAHLVGVVQAEAFGGADVGAKPDMGYLAR